MNENTATLKLYKKINSILKDDKNFEFMNHGYYPVDENLVHSTILLQNSAMLYFYILNKVDLSTVNNLLEVGCGRGGGLSLIKNKYNIKNVYGCDLSKDNIEYCNKNHTDMIFEVQDACNLSYSQKFDVILNIESSHCYSDIKKFFQKTSQYLKNSGIFLYADVFENWKLDIVKNELKKNFFVLDETDITNNVYLSCMNTADTLEKHISSKKCINIDAYNMRLNTCKEKGELYKSKKMFFYVFICKKICYT